MKMVRLIIPTSSRLKEIAIIKLIVISFITGLTSSCLQKQRDLTREECIKIYQQNQDVILTARDVLGGNVYQEIDLERYEHMEVDTSLEGSLIYVKYNFKFKDEKAQLNMIINTTLSFERNEDASKISYDLYDVGFQWGLNGLFNTKRNPVLEEQNLDHVISFGSDSEFTQYEGRGVLLGYHLIGRTENIVVSYYVFSNQTSKHYIDVLKRKIEKIERLNLL